MKRKSCFILLTAVLLMMLSVIPVSAKTTVTVPGVVINEAKGSKEWDYSLQVGIPGKAKWKSGTYSAELLVPADLFIKNGFFSSRVSCNFAMLPSMNVKRIILSERLPAMPFSS